MRKRLLLSLVVVAILLLAGPYLSGRTLAHWHAQAQNDDGSLDLPGLPADWQVSASAWQRGWFSSQLSLTLQPPASACSAPPCQPLSTRSRVHHGPLAIGALPHAAALWPSLAVVVSNIDLNPLVPEKQRPAPAYPPAQILTRVGLTGAPHNRLSLPASRHELQDGTTIEQADLRVSWGADPAEAASLSIARLLMQTANDASLELENAAWQQAPGEQQLTIDQLTLLREGQQPLQLEALALSATTRHQKADEALVSTRFSGEIRNLTHGQQSIAPISIDLQTRNLAIEPLRQLQTSLPIIYRQELPAELQTMALQGLLLRQLPALTRHGPQLTLHDLQLGSGAQAIQASLDLQLQPQADPLKSVTAFLQDIDLDAKVEIPAPIARLLASLRAMQLLRSGQPTTADAILQQWQAEGWMQVEDQRYASRLQLSDAVLHINGNESEAWANWLRMTKARETQGQLERGGIAGQRNWRPSGRPDAQATEESQP